jgi:hypothetical protein
MKKKKKQEEEEKEKEGEEGVEDDDDDDGEVAEEKLQYDILSEQKQNNSARCSSFGCLSENREPPNSIVSSFSPLATLCSRHFSDKPPPNMILP